MHNIILMQEIQRPEQLLNYIDHFSLTKHLPGRNLINQTSSLHQLLHHIIVFPILEYFEDPDNIRMDCFG